MLENKFEIITLIDTYGELVTKNQMDILIDYYFQDISLGEIAENRGISRQAVHDSVVKAVDKLKNFESSLKIVKKQKLLKKILNELHENHTLKDNDYNEILSILEG